MLQCDTRERIRQTQGSSIALFEVCRNRGVGKIITAKRIKRVVLAAILALMLGILGAIIAEQGKGGDLFAFLFLVGLVAYSTLLLKVRRGGFWFCLFCAIEWALLPVATAIDVSQVRRVGFAGIGAAIAAWILLALTLSIGVIGCLIFLALAFFKFRKQH